MNHLLTIAESEISFKDFLFRNSNSRLILKLVAAAVIIQFAIFKYLYPFANFIHGDSFSYIKAAAQNLTISTYPIGYSKFLRLFSVFAKADIVLVAFQYLFVQCSSLFLLFSLFYFYKVGKIMQVIMLLFIVLNPLMLHLSNLISSDCFFLSLSLIWFALLVWILNKPSTQVIIWHAVVLFIAFTTRYNALFYPIIAALVFWLSNISKRRKLLGMGLVIVLCGWFVGLTMFQYKKLTGYWQFSPFSGWQFANNAMYTYREVDTSLYTPVPEKFLSLDNRIRYFFKITKGGTINPWEKVQASTFFMWSPGLPLMKYRDSLFQGTKDSADNFKKWASMGPLYQAYGIYIIKKYPMHFLAFFAGPNTRKYFSPPIEFLSKYNSGADTVTPVATNWFGYKTKYVHTNMDDGETWVLGFIPILNGIANFVLLLGLLYYFLLKGRKSDLVFNRLVFVLSITWLLNASFTIFASSAALRFQSFPVLLNSLFMFLIIDWMHQFMLAMKLRENESENQDKMLSHEVIG